ncbi:TPA: V-type ATP synthase subunit I [bacterium]|nr:V-type ATP synthase subunit I [bacterium]
MAVSQMQRVRIFAHNSHRAFLVKDLQDLELIHIIKVSEEIEPSIESSLEGEVRIKVRNIQNDLTRLQSTIDYLAGFEPKKGLFKGGNPVFSSQEYENIAKDAENGKWQSVCDECQSMQDQLARLTNLEGRLQSEKENLSHWSGLDAPVEAIRDTEKTAIRIGTIPSSTYDLLISEIKSSGILLSVEVVGRSINEVGIVVIFLKSDEQQVLPILAKNGFSVVNLPITKGKVSERIKQIEKEYSEISVQREDIKKRSYQLAQHNPKLMATYDYLREILDQETIKTSFTNTEYTFMIDGWIKKDDVPKLNEIISKKYNELFVEVSDPTDEDEPPVDIQNGFITQPYKMVTQLYSLPKYREIDPTRLFAPFLTLGFAIALTDAGYGIFVAILSLIIAKRSSGGMKNLFKILFVAGLTTVVVGALTGGWFGIPLERLPQFLQNIVVLDPNKSQMLFLGLIVALGYIQILLGFIVKMYIFLKEKEWVGAFLDQFAWILIMVLGPVLIILKRGDASAGIGNVLLGIILLSALMILIFSGREIKNPAGRLGTGFFELYSRVSGTFGDSLSYMRLFALGLATGIIAKAINDIAGMLWGSPGGNIGAIAVLLFGHPFNIVINSLGGFIHSTRLQFVEFFTKFYEGGGEEFKPFKKEKVYITVSELEKSRTA